MKKLMLISSAFVLMSASAFAGPFVNNHNSASVVSFGVNNGALVAQDGIKNWNATSITQAGVANGAGVAQGGIKNINTTNVGQIGKYNVSVTTQSGVGNLPTRRTFCSSASATCRQSPSSNGGPANSEWPALTSGPARGLAEFCF